MQRILSLIGLLICILATCQQINAACGPPMCNDNVLFAPAMVKLLYNHMHGNTTLPTKVGGPPCTACLPCCRFLASIEQSTIDQRDEIQALNTVVDSIDWTCKSNECAQHHVELRNMVTKVVEEKSQPLLEAMSLKSTTSANTDSITQSIREHLEMYSRQVKRSRDFEKTKNENQFLSRLLSCPCTACLNECAVRKMLFKFH